MLDQLYPIIVNWNLKDDTTACVDSLLTAGIPLERIILVDNASTDGSIVEISKRFGEKLCLIANLENLGYASGLNIGIQHARKIGAEWVFLLNNDTVVATDLFQELEKAAESNPTISIISPQIRYHQDPTRIWSLGDRLIPGTLLTRSLGANQIDRGQFSPVVAVDFITGCAMLIRMDVFETAGLFPTGYFMYAEEVDFLWRARKDGFRPVVATRALIWHKVSASTASEPSQRQYWRIFNQVRFYRKYATPFQKPGLFMFTLIRSIMLTIQQLIQCTSALQPHYLAGWTDGWFKPVHQRDI